MEQKDWGLVLAGGGGKGAYQIGVWRALREFGLEKEITAVSGVSVGALNAALFSLSDLEAAEDIWNHIDPLTFLDIELSGGEKGDGIFARDGLLKLMEERIDFQKISACEKELYVNASHLEGGKMLAEYFLLNGKSEEEIKSLLLASSALPVIYDSVKIGDKSYRDGGLKDNLPIQPLHQAGYRKLILVGLNPQTQANVFDYPDTRFLPILPSRDLGDFISGTLDFTREGASRRMKLGYQDSKAVLSWYFSDQEQPWTDFLASCRQEGEAAYQQIKKEQKLSRLEEEINQELSKIKELMKKYGVDDRE